MSHRNDMSGWPEIACRRGHAEHATRTVHVDLAHHGYHDYPQVPAHLVKEFGMVVYDPKIHPVDGGPYCPAHDAVSATIVSHGIWEPAETIFVLEACRTAEPDQIVVDVGAQLGWFSCLAAASGLDVYAYDADAVNLANLEWTALENGWNGVVEERRIHLRYARIGVDEAFLPIAPTRLVKIDVEGAEDKAIEWLDPLLSADLVDFMLVEVTPVFETGYYPDLVCDLVCRGFDPYLLPRKSDPPAEMDDPFGLGAFGSLLPLPTDPAELAPLVASWNQENVVFARRGLL